MIAEGHAACAVNSDLIGSISESDANRANGDVCKQAAADAAAFASKSAAPIYATL